MRLVRLLTAGAVAALAIFGAAPAHARAQPTLGVFLDDRTITPTSGVGAHVTLSAPEPITLEHVAVTFDFSDISSFATVEPRTPSDCSETAPAVLTCRSSISIQV